MPVVHVTYFPLFKNFVLSDKILKGLGEAIADAVAANFTCEDPEGSLTSDDIEVYFHHGSSLDKTDYQVFVDVEAKSFPGREATFEYRTDTLRADIRQMLPKKVSSACWVKLVNAAWADSPAR